VSRIDEVRPEFVDLMPSTLEDGVVYVSIEYGTVIHRCCCGCGEKIVTPLHPTQWRMTYDGETISLHPSVGGHDLPCRSHYVIKNNHVLWSKEWTAQQVARGRSADRGELLAHYNRSASPQPRQSWWRRLMQRR
jgi:hypothetical protein